MMSAGRAGANLRRQYRAILSYVGIILTLASGLMVAPLLAFLAQPAERIHIIGFLFPAIALFTLGILMWRIFRPRKATILTAQEGGVAVLLSWALVCLFSAYPFVAIQKLNFTQSIFESVSGWTTTGLSVVDVTQASRCILLWRSVMQLAGGAGLAVIMLAAIAGPVGTGLYTAEGRGEQQIVPHVIRSAKLVISIYIGYALAGIIAYRLAGMSLFDSVNHAFAAISTGGFSTEPESIGHWNSVAIEAVTMPLMIFGNVNFLTAYLLLRGRFKSVYRNGEIRLMAVLLPIGIFILLFLVCRTIYPTLSKSIRVSVFEAVSALTTTGFSTVSYEKWNSVGFLMLIVLMIIGGGTCSTAGGIKQHRIHLMLKSLCWEMRRSFLPRTAVVENYVWRGERKDFIDDKRIRQVATFIFLYLTTYFLGAGIISAHGYSVRESLFEFASALGTVGLSVGVTAPSAPSTLLWTEALGMFLGRLEFFVVFVSLGKIIRDLFDIWQ